MFKLKHVQPVAEEERDGIIEPPRHGAPGQKLILLATSSVAAVLILFGIASRNNYFGLLGAAKTAHAQVQLDAHPVNAPDLQVPLAMGGAPAAQPSYVECPGGLRLPLGLACPPAQSASQPTPAPSSDGSQAQRVRERRLNGGIELRTTSGTPASGSSLEARGAAALALTSGGGVGVLGQALYGTSTPGASASRIAHPSLTLAKGTLPDCTLLTAILTDQPGFLKCLLSAPVMSMDGKVVLMEAGTTMEGEYTAGVQAGQTTIFTLWTRAVTPHFVTVPLSSPGTDALGRAGTAGYVDNKWLERFAGAVFFSLFEDVKQVAIAKDDARAARRASNASGDTYNLGAQGTLSQLGNTDSTSQAVVQEMLRQGSQVHPSLSKNQGDIIKIFVARDVDFSEVYALRPARGGNGP